VTIIKGQHICRVSVPHLHFNENSSGEGTDRARRYIFLKYVVLIY